MQSMKSRFVSFVSYAVARSNGIGILGARISTYHLTIECDVPRFAMERKVNGGISCSMKTTVQRLFVVVATIFTSSCFRMTERFESQRSSNDGNRSLGRFCGLGGVGPAVAGQHERPCTSTVTTSPFPFPEVVTADACGAIAAVAASFSR